MMRGWKVLSVILAVIVACCAVSAWAFIAFLAPVALGTGEVWPRDQTALLWLAVGTMIVGVVLGFVLDYSSLWTDRLPLLSDSGSAASLAGSALGSLAASVTFAAAVRDAAAIVVIAGAIGVVFAWFAWRRYRTAVREARSHDRELARVDALHAEGTRIRADVVDVRFHNTWVGGDAPLFTVTAEYDTPSGRQHAEGRTITTPETAPIVGGTVLLWFAGDGSDTSNVDIWRDPESIADPDATEAYRAPTA
ncbi:hypothetical protein [Microbacterium sp.]|uniref:hypothetical protein n=1 Tax=Microbacterium sp. TaxID=51671 RepID=UPI002D809730|nr:hypothetical protein [Microbacterium sp.]